MELKNGTKQMAWDKKTPSNSGALGAGSRVGLRERGIALGGIGAQLAKMVAVLALALRTNQGAAANLVDAQSREGRQLA